MPSRTIKQLRQWHSAARAALEDRVPTPGEDHDYPRLQRFLHFWVLVGRSFVRNKCPVRASSLAYASLLALVPMLAVAIGISSSLLKKSEEPVHNFVTKLVESVTPDASADAWGLRRLGATNEVASVSTTAEEAAKARLVESTREAIKERINEFVANTRSTTMSATGVVALLAVALLMLARIEETFNDIWGVTKGRSWFNRVMQYWAALSLGPILWATAIALTGGQYFLKVQELVNRLGPLAEWAVNLGLGFLPYVILSVAFGALYMLMPNTRVDWRAAAVGGVVAGTLWQLNQEFSFFYVSRVVSNSRIYGSLSAIPVFMIGLYISWIIVLLGAQVAYAYQNRRSYLEERQVETVNQRSREFVALRLLTRIAQHFHRGEPPPSLGRLSEALGIPSRLANQVLGALANAGLVTEVAGGDGAYLPARPSHKSPSTRSWSPCGKRPDATSSRAPTNRGTVFAPSSRGSRRPNAAWLARSPSRRWSMARRTVLHRTAIARRGPERG
ncbi:MAG: YihY family inner membrane protein [Verrucomicrobia bacterium]|nr:YihY family inner membrane protein [Verrucomicrobiota bacterium]